LHSGLLIHFRRHGIIALLAAAGAAAPPQADPEEGGRGKILGPERRRACVRHVQVALGVSERRAFRALGQPRSTQRRTRRVRSDEAALTEAIVASAAEYGRYGYRRITAMLRADGWRVNAKRVQRIWRREGLKVPRRQPKRGRLWLNDGSCIRLRPCWPGHVWAYDFVQDRTHDGRITCAARELLASGANDCRAYLSGHGGVTGCARYGGRGWPCRARLRRSG
jgi:hypothetical protein